MAAQIIYYCLKADAEMMQQLHDEEAERQFGNRYLHKPKNQQFFYRCKRQHNRKKQRGVESQVSVH